MRSELFRIPIELGGVPLFGLGLLLLLWLVGWLAGMLLFSRRAANPEPSPTFAELLWINAPVVIGGAALILFLPRLFSDGVPIRGYGVMLLLAASTGLAMAVHRAKMQGIDPEKIYSITFWMFVFGIAGARLFFVIEYWDVAFVGETFLDRLTKALFFTEGGLVVYGSLIGAAGVFVWRCIKEKLPVLAMADLFAPSLAIGLAIGRIGCLLNGCCYGGVCEQPWAVTFPDTSPPYVDQVVRGEMHGIRLSQDDTLQPPQVRLGAVRTDEPGLEPGERIVAVNGSPLHDLHSQRNPLADAYYAAAPLRVDLESGKSVTLPVAPIRKRSLPVHPTQIYSAVNAGLLGWFLWAYYPSRRRDGEVIGLLLSIYPISRFLLEIIRTDESAFLATGLSISQNLSVAILVSMGLFWVWMSRLPPTRALEIAAR